MSDSELPLLISNARERYSAYTQQTSTIMRSLAIACVGVVWLVGAGVEEDAQSIILAISADPALRWSMVLAIAAIVCDALQYATASAGWGVYGWVLSRMWTSRGRTDFRGDPLKFSSIFGLDLLAIKAAGDVSAIEVSRLATGPRGERREAALEALGRLSTDSPAPELRQPRAPRWVNRIVLGLFWIKVLLVIAAYATLIVTLVRLLFPGVQAP